MKISVVSDLHLERYQNWQSVVRHVGSVPADVLVIAGDMANIAFHPWHGALRLFSKLFPHVVYVLGNHEHYGTTEADYKIEVKDIQKDCSNLNILEDRTVCIDGVTFAGTSLWFDICVSQVESHWSRLNDLYQIEKPWERINQWHNRSKEFLGSLTGADIVVTHHAPSFQCVHPRYAEDPLNCFFANHLDDTIKQVGAKYWIHGHMHDRVNTEIEGTRVLCNPLGYPKQNMWHHLVISL